MVKHLLLVVMVTLLLGLTGCGNSTANTPSGGTNPGSNGNGSGNNGSATVTQQQQADFRQWLDASTRQLNDCVHDPPRLQKQAQNAVKTMTLDDSVLQATIQDCQGAVPSALPASILLDNALNDTIMGAGSDFSSQALKAAQDLDNIYNGLATTGEAQKALDKASQATSEYASYLSTVSDAKQTYGY